MTHQDTDNSPDSATPPGRVPGRYVVFGFLVFGALFFGFMMLLALKIDPAVADRFHRGIVPTQK